MSYDALDVTMDQMIDLIAIVTSRGWVNSIKAFEFSRSEAAYTDRCDIDFIKGPIENLYWWPDEPNQNNNTKVGMWRFQPPMKH